MKIRAFYTRNGDLKFISHLNTINLLQRAVFSTNEEVAFSEGFNPHPKMSFGNPLPLGVSSDLEVFDVEFINDIDIPSFTKKMNEYLPKEVQIVRAYGADGSESISKIIKNSIYEYTIYTEIDLSNFDINIDDELTIVRERKTKKNHPREFIRENIAENVNILSNFEKVDEDTYLLIAQLENSVNKIINPMNFINGLFEKLDIEISIEDVSIHKKDMR